MQWKLRTKPKSDAVDKKTLTDAAEEKESHIAVPKSGAVDKKMLIDAAEEEESRIAVIENGKLQELYIQRSAIGEIAGNIYKGIVLNVEPAIDAAFVNFGGPRNGFLHASDVMPSYSKSKTPTFTPAPSSGRRGDHKIRDFLKPGQEVVVQVTREGLRGKGPSLTTYISLPGRYLVLMPGVKRRAISRKIADDKQRDRLKKIVADLNLPDELGMILRTAGEGRTRRDIERDLDYLLRLWHVMARRIKRSNPPCLIYQESDLVTRAIRDIFSSDMKKVIINSEPVYKKTIEFIKGVMPRYRSRVQPYAGLEPLFYRYHVENEIDLIAAKNVSLKSGGSIVIEQTEALVAIDVNSGKYLQGADAEETAFKTNLEAVEEIARQLRLRDLGGVIINDFIDMEREQHRRAVEQALNAALKRDRARIRVARTSRFGTIALTRQRVRPGVVTGSFEKCSCCGGSGQVRTIRAAAVDATRRIRKEIARGRPRELRIMLSPDVATYIYNHKRATISEMEERSNLTIEIVADPSLTRNGITIETNSTSRRPITTKG